MFDDIMGNLEEQQKLMRQKLQQVAIQVELEGVLIIGNANKEITNIAIDEKLLSPSNKEMTEDLILTSVNRFIEKASHAEAEQTKTMMNEILPPGFENMFK